jgi:hypothetical protein
MAAKMGSKDGFMRARPGHALRPKHIINISLPLLGMLLFGSMAIAQGAKEPPPCPPGSQPVHSKAKDGPFDFYECRVSGKDGVNGIKEWCREWEGTYWNAKEDLPCGSRSSEAVFSKTLGCPRNRWVEFGSLTGQKAPWKVQCLPSGWTSIMPDDKGKCPAGFVPAGSAPWPSDICIGPNKVAETTASSTVTPPKSETPESGPKKRAAAAQQATQPPSVLENWPHPGCPKGTQRVPGSSSGISYRADYSVWSDETSVPSIWYRCQSDKSAPARFRELCAVLHQKGDDNWFNTEPLQPGQTDFDWQMGYDCLDRRANIREPSTEDAAVKQRADAKTPAGFCQLYPKAVYKEGVDGGFPRGQFDFVYGMFPHISIDEESDLRRLPPDAIPCRNNPEHKNAATLLAELPQRLEKERSQQEQIHQEQLKAEERMRQERLKVEEVALARLTAHWPKSQCTKAVNGFFKNAGEIAASKDAMPASLIEYVSMHLEECARTYTWPYQERNQLVISLPFDQVADKEQEFLSQFLNVKMLNFIGAEGLNQQFAVELGHNTILLQDSSLFLARHDLMQKFLQYDEARYNQKKLSEAVGASLHIRALLCGVAE